MYLKNFTFKVFPTQSGLENKQKFNNEPIQEYSSEPEATEPDVAKKPCPCPPKVPCPIAPVAPCPPQAPMPVSPPIMPCPPFSPAPAPPQMPYPPMGPMAPIMPCPPMGPMPYPISPGFIEPQHPAYAAPPFTCPYFRLAHSYVPWQNYNVVFNPSEALDRGTLFPELCMPQGNYGPCEGPQPCGMMVPWGGVPYGSM